MIIYENNISYLNTEFWLQGKKCNIKCQKVTKLLKTRARLTKLNSKFSKIKNCPSKYWKLKYIKWEIYKSIYHWRGS